MLCCCPMNHLRHCRRNNSTDLLAWVRAGGSVCIVPDVPMKPLQSGVPAETVRTGADSTANLSLDAEGRLLVVSDENDPILMSHCGLGRAVLAAELSRICRFACRKRSLGVSLLSCGRFAKISPSGRARTGIQQDLVQTLKDRGESMSSRMKKVFLVMHSIDLQQSREGRKLLSGSQSTEISIWNR